MREARQREQQRLFCRSKRADGFERKNQRRIEWRWATATSASTTSEEKEEEEQQKQGRFKTHRCGLLRIDVCCFGLSCA